MLLILLMAAINNDEGKLGTMYGCPEVILVLGGVPIFDYD